MATGAPDARVSALAIGIALAAHAIVVAAVATVTGPAWLSPPQPVEFEFREPPPPPPEVTPPPPLPPPPPEPPKPKLVVKRAPIEPPPPVPEAPPPPNQEPPPETPPANTPPTFGVTMSSVVEGTSGMAVPVGNTLMAKPAIKKAEGPPRPYSGNGTQPGGMPAAEISVATLPEVLFQVNGDDIYPPDAKALGIEGKVKASITISEKGDVTGVRILEKAGHGFDEAASQALRRFRFSPARTSDGRAVPYRLTWNFRFSIGE